MFSQVTITKDMPELDLKAGDVATVVDHFPKGKNPEDGYALEFFNAVGDTIAVEILPESDIRALTEDEVIAIRHRVAQAA